MATVIITKKASVRSVKPVSKTVTKTVAKKATPKAIEFRFLAPLSKRVSVGGDFNAWNGKKNPLKKAVKTGIWSTTVKLKPGRYQYRFVVDGRWENDNQRQTELIGNGLGEVNNIIVVA